MCRADNLMFLVTGSQGERRAASAQLANGKYRGHKLKEGDLFLFSSKTIPGNERGVIKIINQLSEIGVDVVDDALPGAYHVSGHANRPDLEDDARFDAATDFGAHAWRTPPSACACQFGQSQGDAIGCCGQWDGNQPVRQRA